MDRGFETNTGSWCLLLLQIEEHPMGFWQKIFGSAKSSAPKTGDQSTVISLQCSDPSVFCDGCNQPSSFAAGTYYTASEFITLVKKGWSLTTPFSSYDRSAAFREKPLSRPCRVT